MSIKPSEVIAYCEAATEGPMHKVPDAHGVNWVIQNDIGEVLGVAEGHIEHGWDENATFMINARTDLPALAAFAQEIVREFEDEESDFFQGRGYCYDNFRRIAANHGIDNG